MLKYRRVLELDNELYQFHLRQKGYYMLQEIIPTKEYLINDMVIPDGFDEVDHFIYKVYCDFARSESECFTVNIVYGIIKYIKI